MDRFGFNDRIFLFQNGLIMRFRQDQIKIHFFQKRNGRLQWNRGSDGGAGSVNKIGHLEIGIDVQDLDRSGHDSASFS